MWLIKKHLNHFLKAIKVTRKIPYSRQYSIYQNFLLMNTLLEMK